MRMRRVLRGVISIFGILVVVTGISLIVFYSMSYRSSKSYTRVGRTEISTGGKSSAVQSIFQCHGSCYCVPKEEEIRDWRASSSVVTKSVWFGIAALSASFALSQGSRFISKECNRLFSSSCDFSTHKLLSEVESCTDEETEASNSGDVDRMNRWMCSGNCVAIGEYTFAMEKMGELNQLPKEEKEEYLKFAERMQSSEFVEDYKKIQCMQVHYSDGVEAKTEVDAIYRFNADILHPFCDEISQIQRVEDGVNIDYHLCTSNVYTVSCKLLFDQLNEK